MTRVTLADVILRSVPVTARKAVTLTLAVAREWDRQQALHGPIPLPDVASIQLDETGDVSFLVTPSTSDGQITVGLSGLLGRLLRTDESDPTNHALSPGVLVAGVSGGAQVPTV